MDAEKKQDWNFKSCIRGSRQLSDLFIGKGEVLEYRKEKQGRVWVELEGSLQSLQQEGRFCREMRSSGKDSKAHS